MSLSDLAAIGSFVSGIAVLISLVFLYFQLRQIGVQVHQAERNQQASIRDNRASRIVDIIMRSTDPSLSDAILKVMRGDEDISETQFRQFNMFFQARLIHAEEALSQYRDGLLNQSSFDQVGKSLRVAFSYPGARAIYSRIRPGFPDEFVAYADKIVASTPVGSAPDLWASFRSDVADEKAKENV